MSRHHRPRRNSRKRPSAPFLEKGLLSLVVAGSFWLAGATLSGGDSLLAPIGKSLRAFLWFPLTIGLGLLGVHFVLKRMAGQDSPLKNVATQNAKIPSVVKKPDAHDSAWAHSAQDTSRPINEDPGHGQAATLNEMATPAPWSSKVFEVIEWRRFEALVEALFAQAGFETRSQSHGADGGVDIWLHSRNAQGPVAVVQCKHWQGKPVGVREMREFLGAMASHGLQRGTYATSSTFTSDALAFAKANGINAQDGSSLLRMILNRTPEQQAALLAVATEGDYRRPTCASCGVKMVERTPKNGGSAFWGCMSFPRCRATLPMRSAAP